MATLPRSQARRSLAVLALIALVLSLLVGVSPGADAALPYSTTATPFGGVDGFVNGASPRVYDVHVIGDQLWAGGRFSEGRHPDTSWAGNRDHLAIFNINTGDLLPLVHDANDPVQGIESDGATRIWVGGEFTSISGVTTSVAAFDAITGQIDPTFVVNTNGGDVNDVMLHNGWLYIAGEFQSVNGQFADYFARVDPQTGALDTGFAPRMNDFVREIAAWNDIVYAGGWFTQVGSNTPRDGVSGFNATTGAPAGPFYDLPTNIHIRTIFVSDDGANLYTGDESRANTVSSFDRTSGALLWDRTAEGDVQAVAATNDRVLVGTHDGWDVPSDERLLISLDRTTGATDNSWAPLMDPDFMGIYDIEIGPDYLIATGEIVKINSLVMRRIGVFRSSNWQPAEPLVTPTPTPSPTPEPTPTPTETPTPTPTPTATATPEPTPTPTETPTPTPTPTETPTPTPTPTLTPTPTVTPTPTATATPTLTPTPTPTPPSGDVNCDANANIVDALLISQFVVGTREAVDVCPLADPITQIYEPSGDITGDGNVSIVDALAIAQCSAGVQTPYC